jgi:hypothetical protein
MARALDRKTRTDVGDDAGRIRAVEEPPSIRAPQAGCTRASDGLRNQDQRFERIALCVCGRWKAANLVALVLTERSRDQPMTLH